MASADSLAEMAVIPVAILLGRWDGAIPLFDPESLGYLVTVAS